jgi:type 1 fimbria pilin
LKLVMVRRTTLAVLLAITGMAAAAEPAGTVTFDCPGAYPVRCTPNLGGA